MTGSFALAEEAGVHTFRYRQSSLGPWSRKTISGKTSVCIQRGVNSTVFRTPVQLAAGWGVFHRNEPAGGAANGMPLKICTVESALVVPSTVPLSVCTRSDAVRESARANGRSVFPVTILLYRQRSR